MAKYNVEMNIKQSSGYDQLDIYTDASVVTYDNTTTQLESTNIQDAIDELVIDAPFDDFKGTDGTEAGEHGLVPAPKAGEQDKLLSSDGSWYNIAKLIGGIDGPIVSGIAQSDIPEGVVCRANTEGAPLLTDELTSEKINVYGVPVFSPDGMYAYFVGDYLYSYKWNGSKYVKFKQYPFVFGYIDGPVISKDGRYLFVPGNGPKWMGMQLYEVNGGELTYLFGSTIDSSVHIVAAFSPDSTLLVYSRPGYFNTNELMVYNLSTKTGTHITMDGQIRDIRFSSDSSLLFVGGYFSTGVNIYNVSNGTVSYANSIAQEAGHKVNTIDVSPDGKFIAVGTNTNEYYASIYTLSGTNTTYIGPIYADNNYTPMSYEVLKIRFSPDGSKMVIGGKSYGHVSYVGAKLYNITQEGEDVYLNYVENIVDPNGNVIESCYYIEFNQDGSMIVCQTNYTTQTYLYDVTNKTKYIQDFSSIPSTYILKKSLVQMQYNKNGDKLIVGDDYGGIYLYEVDGKDFIFKSKIVTSGQNKCLSLSFINNDTMIACGDTSKIYIYSIENNELTFITSYTGNEAYYICDINNTNYFIVAYGRSYTELVIFSISNNVITRLYISTRYDGKTTYLKCSNDNAYIYTLQSGFRDTMFRIFTLDLVNYSLTLKNSQGFNSDACMTMNKENTLAYIVTEDFRTSDYLYSISNGYELTLKDSESYNYINPTKLEFSKDNLWVYILDEGSIYSTLVRISINNLTIGDREYIDYPSGYNGNFDALIYSMCLNTSNGILLLSYRKHPYTLSYNILDDMITFSEGHAIYDGMDIAPDNANKIAITQEAIDEGSYGQAKLLMSIGERKFIAPPWGSGSFDKIIEALEAHYGGQDVDFSAWAIGDKRSIVIDNTIYQLVLAHKFNGAPSSNTSPYAFNGEAKYPTYAVLCIPQCGTSRYMDTNEEQKYFNGTLHTYCNTTIYNKIKNNDIGQCLKSFQCYVGKENGEWYSETYGTYNQQVYLASLACKEIGKNNGYNSDENNALITFDYFNGTDADLKRQIAGEDYYWLRSPSCSDGQHYLSYQINASDDSIKSETVNNVHGVVWFGCI